MRRPLDGTPPVTQGFGETDVDYSQFGLKGHHGTDYGVGTGTPVYAAEAGIVEKSANGVTDKYTGRFAAGETVIINGTYECWYMHLSRRLVSAGQRVTEGQLIGYSGATGYVTGPHLHFGIRPLRPDLDNGYRGFIDFATVLFAKQPTPQGGDEVIPDLDNYYWRIGQKLASQIRGRHLSRDEFRRHIVGKSMLRAVEILSDDAEADRVQKAQEVGQVAVRDDWQGQIVRANEAIAKLQVALKNEQNKPPVEVIKEVEKVVEKQVEVVKEIPVYVHDQETKDNVNAILKLLKSLWGSLTSLHKKVK